MKAIVQDSQSCTDVDNLWQSPSQYLSIWTALCAATRKKYIIMETQICISISPQVGYAGTWSLEEH